MKGQHRTAMIETHTCYPVVYIAGPIRNDPQSGARNALTMAGWMIQRDLAVPMVVHTFYLVSLMGVEGWPKQPESWLHLDAEYIKRADALYRIHGDSPGADREVEFARKMGMPTFVEAVEVDPKVMVDFAQWTKHFRDEFLSPECSR